MSEVVLDSCAQQLDQIGIEPGAQTHRSVALKCFCLGCAHHPADPFGSTPRCTASDGIANADVLA